MVVCFVFDVVVGGIQSVFRNAEIRFCSLILECVDVGLKAQNLVLRRIGR